MTVPGSANPLLLRSAAPTAYQVSRSIRLNAPDSAYLSRTPGSAGNRKTWTWSGWVKRSSFNTELPVVNAYTNVNDRIFCGYIAGDVFQIYSPNGAGINVSTSAVYRDPSAWYHLVISFDTTQATASSRVRVYINGIEQTLSGTFPGQNTDWPLNNTVTHYLGSTGSTYYFNGCLANVEFIDGFAKVPGDFAETDATTGQWVPKQFSGSYGSQGWKLTFADNSNNTASTLGADTSSNGNHWTPTNLSVDNAIALPAVGFDGSGDYLRLGGTADLDFGTSDFTIEGWVLSTGGTGTYQHILTGGTSWTTGSGGIYWYYNSGSPYIGAAWNQIATNPAVNSGTLAINKWHHFAFVRNTNTLTLYVNGTSVDTLNVSGTSLAVNNQSQTNIGGGGWDQDFAGHLSNLHVVKGTALYTSNFTPPSAPLAAVANTKLLCCQSSTSSTAAAVSPGTITAAGNVFATTRTDSAPGNDSLVDTPTSYGTGTSGGDVRGNFCTLNPLDNGGMSLSNGSLDLINTASTDKSCRATVAVSSGKWYWEILATDIVASDPSKNSVIGIAAVNTALPIYPGNTATSWGYVNHNGVKLNNNSGSSYGNTWATNDIISVAFDADNGKLYFAKNGTWQASGDPSAGTNAAFTGITGSSYAPCFNAVRSGALAINFGQRAFAYTPPANFKPLVDTYLPTPTIAKPSTVMDVALYTGASSTTKTVNLSNNVITPDLVWIKTRGPATSYDHMIYDSVRGVNINLRSNKTDAETSGSPSEFTAFGTGSFTVQSNSVQQYVNETGQSYVAWCWDAGSSTVTNTQGSITSQVRANASAGFSIVTYTGDGTTNKTVGHNLNSKPGLILVKCRNTSDAWNVYHSALGANYWLNLNTTGTPYSGYNGGSWNNTEPTSSVFTVNLPSGYSTGFTNENGINYVAYVFSPVTGYSAMSSFVGNGSSDGVFQWCGFRPRFLMYKPSNRSGTDWVVWDTARNPYNVCSNYLLANSSGAEGSIPTIDILSNGFKLRTASTGNNGAGDEIIWAAWAESPFQYARAR